MRERLRRETDTVAIRLRLRSFASLKMSFLNKTLR